MPAFRKKRTASSICGAGGRENVFEGKRGVLFGWRALQSVKRG
jgi:hypothetical protein